MRRNRGRALVSASAMGLVLAAGAVLQGCAGNSDQIALPLQHGWYEGLPVDYVTTDISSASMAQAAKVNYVPRLANLLPANQPQPNPHSAIARIYKFLNYVQPSVLPSIPNVPGAGVIDANGDDDYTPLWLLMGVTWQAGHTPRELRSEAEVLHAQAAGEVAVESLNTIVNCPVVRVGAAALPPAHEHSGY